MRFTSLAFLALLFATQIGFSQDVLYSRMSNSGLYLNPAFAGCELHQNISALYKLQWKNLGFPYSSSNISLVKPIFPDKQAAFPKGGIGIDLNSEIAGEAKYSMLMASINPCYNIVSYNQKDVISGALKLGFRQRTLASHTLEWGTQFDPYNGYDSDLQGDPLENDFRPIRIMPDIGAGFIFAHDYLHHDVRQRHFGFITGYAAYHLNRPNESFFKGVKSPTPISHRAFGTLMLTSPVFNFKPTVAIIYQREDALIQTGADLDIMMHEKDSPLVPDMILLGARYNTNNLISGMLGLKNNYWTIGFNYDVAAGAIEKYSSVNSGWEIFVRIQKPHVEETIKTPSPDRY